MRFAAPLAAEAQQAGKVARIGFLATNPAAGDPHLREAFRQGLRDLGYVEGRNLVIEYRDAEGKLERLPALAAELVALKVDVIVAARHTRRPGRQASDHDPPHCLHCCWRSGCRAGSSPALRGRAAMSRGCPSSPRSSSASVWNCSSRPFRGSVGSLSSGSQTTRRTHGEGHAEGSRSRGAGAGGAASIR